jgi:acetylornithine/succinyldiaminopimelate/putrescine aminotransferase/predicted amino acid dehydrogenase
VWRCDVRGRRYLDLDAGGGELVLGHPGLEGQGAGVESAPPPIAGVAALEAALAEACTFLDPDGRPSGSPTVAVVTSGRLAALGLAGRLAQARTDRPRVVHLLDEPLGAGGRDAATQRALSWPAGLQWEQGSCPSVDTLDALFAPHQAPVGALILEPVEPEHGGRPISAALLTRARELCSAREAVFVLDATRMGLGLDPALCGAHADVLLVSRGLSGGGGSVGGCLVSPRWLGAPLHSPREQEAVGEARRRVPQGGSFGMTCLHSASRVRRVHDAARRGELERCAAVLARGLARVAERYPELIEAQWCSGLWGGLRLRPPSMAKGLLLPYLSTQGSYGEAVVALLRARCSVLAGVAPADSQILSFTPPRSIRQEQLDAGMDAVAALFALLQRDGAAAVLRSQGGLAGDVTFSAAPSSDLGGTREDGLTGSGVPRPLSAAPRYALLLCYRGPEGVGALEPTLARYSTAERAGYCRNTRFLPPGVVAELPPLAVPPREPLGGLAVLWPTSPIELRGLGARWIRHQLERSFASLARAGVRAVGLDRAVAEVVAQDASVVAAAHDLSLCTGASLCAAMAVVATREVVEGRGGAFSDSTVAVVGAATPLGRRIARILMWRQHPRRLVLVHPPASVGAASDAARATERSELAALCEEAETAFCSVELAADLAPLFHSDVVISAIGSGVPILDGAPLSPGTIVCDAAEPGDGSPRLRARRDLRVFQGGLVAAPDASQPVDPLGLLGPRGGVLRASHAEAMLLALHRAHGDPGAIASSALDLLAPADPLAAVDRITALAERYGFEVLLPSLDSEVRPAAALAEAARQASYATHSVGGAGVLRLTPRGR